MSSATKTTDHEKIRAWVEEHGGRPSMVKTKGEGGILRIDFGKPEESLEEVEWDEFFKVFDDNDLAFLYQDEGDSRFNKFVARN